MNTRRTFLQQAALLTTALAIGPGRLFSRPVHPKGFHKIGLQLYTLREALAKDVKGTIEKVAAIGYNQVETFYGEEGPYSTHQFWGLNPTEFKALLKTNGLTTPSGHYQLNNFLTPGNGKVDSLHSQVAIAAAVGQEYFVVPVPPLYLWDKHPATADDYKFIAAQLNKAGEYCKQSNLKMAYHNHFWEFRKLPGSESTGYDILLQETSPSLVHFELDLFWAVKSGIDPVALFKKAPGRFPMLHIKDIDKANTATIVDTGNKPSMDILSGVTFTEVGNGSVHFKEILKDAATGGVKYLFVEQDKIKIDPFESIRQSYNYVKQQLLTV
jgi:sugar phosphate isomerase/epimerase